jgi:rhodanese-related sulfurtransferase
VNYDGVRFAPVTRAVRAPANEVWAALSEPDMVRKWWGELSSPFRLGYLSQLTLGDGDVLLVEIIKLEPPRCLELGLRLFGIAPKQTIRWEIITKEDGCLVTVGDSALEPDGDRWDAERNEWLFYSERLQKCLEQAALPPVPQASEFILSTDLPGNTAAVRAHLAKYLGKILNSTHDPFVEPYRAALSLPDGAERDAIEIAVGPADPTACSVSLELDHASWLFPTSARLQLRQREQGTRLSIRHRGWAAIAFDDETRARQRARFAQFWHKFFMRFTLDYARSWQIPTLSAADLESRMGRPDVFVFDANRTTLWERGHLPRSVFVGQEDIPIDRLPADKNAELVFYCRDSMCLTAYLSAAQARTLGYPNSLVMEGGRAAWAKSGFPLVSQNGTAASDQEEPEAFETGV